MPTEKNVFRKLDSDSSPLMLPAGAALDMLNVRVTETGCYNVKGTEVRFNDGAGTAFNLYRCVGAYEDKQGDSVVFFMSTLNQSPANTLNRIYRYFPTTRTYELIFSWTGLNLTEIKDIAMVGDILIWTDGIGEIKQLNVTRKVLYDKLIAAPDGVTYVDTSFHTLIKRPPGMPLKINIDGQAVESIDDGYQFTYRYVFVDNERSVFAPFTALYFYSKLQLDLFAFNEQIPGNAIAVEYGYRKNNGGDVFIFRKQTLSSPPKTSDVFQLFDFEDKMVAEIVPAEEAMRLFDAIPLKADTLTVARNRVFIGSYTEDYDYFNTLTMALVKTSVAASTIVSGSRVHKAKGQKQYGLVPVDFAGRTFGVITKPEWVVSTDDFMVTGGNLNAGFTGVVTKITATINGTYPSWVKYFDVVVTKDLNASFFIQGYGYLVHRLGDFEGEDVFGQIYPAAYPPKETYIEIAGLSLRGIGYTYEDGDYVNIRFRNRETSTIIALDNIRIRGQRGSLIQIDGRQDINLYYNGLNTDGSYNAYDGLIFEIFRPYKPTENEPFYTIGQRFRTNSNGSALVNKVIEIQGDVYQLENTQYNDGRYADYTLWGNGASAPYSYPIPQQSVSYPYIQAMSPFDRQYSMWFNDFGKAYLHLPDTKQKYKKNYERFSNKFLAGTKINGLNTFEALNEKDLPIENGGIKRLILASNVQAEGSVLLAIMQNETESQYLGEAQFRDTQGNTTLAISSQVIGSTNTLRGGYGTVNPESVVADDNGNVYWWDATKGEPVRYGADGLAPLATICDMRGFFRELSKAQLELGRQPISNTDALNPKVYGGYDPVNQEYLMHFKAVVDSNDPEGGLAFGGFTIAYNNRLKAFTSRYDFQPERFVKSNTLLFSFAKGKMWEHEAGLVCNNFYADQFNSTIRFVSNQEPHAVKIWTSVAIEGQTLWLPKELKNEMNQASEMKADWFQNKEGMFYGAIRRNTKGKTGDDAIRALNNGTVLRSTYLDILIENDSTELTRLDAVNIMYVVSSGHTTIN